MPPHWHINLDELCRLGIPPINTVEAPGIQGAIVMGMQGMGTKTPNAAAVAAATIGFAGQLHMPNGRTLTMGMWSMMLAAGVPVKTRLTGSTISTPGAKPKLHLRVAPIAA